ncbi:MAG: hypothetical protein ACRER2_14340, partial [Methylococcales bacterium]
MIKTIDNRTSLRLAGALTLTLAAGPAFADSLVVDEEAGTGGRGALFRVDPAGALLVVDFDAGTGLNGALFRVDPAGGNRTLLSDFGDAGQGPLGVD